jgi:hypothetical protein
MEKTITKRNGAVTTTATMLPNGAGFFNVYVIHRFDSGNFVKEPVISNQSEVAALGLLNYYTS